jgi:O-antigen ligase
MAVGLGIVAAAAACGAAVLNQPASPGRAPVHQASDFLHGRGHEWSTALQVWFDRPSLGAGADAYYVASVRQQTIAASRFAHDLPLELAAELGVVGLLLGLALYASSVRVILRARGSASLWLLAPLVGAFLVSNLVDWTWHLAGLGCVWAAASGGLAASRMRD